MTWARPADWGDSIHDVQNAAGNPLFKVAELSWTKPVVWNKGDRKPAFDDTEPFVYALVRNNGNFREKDHIEYIGLTTSPKTRFGGHGTALEIVAQRGEVKFSYAKVDFIKGKNRIERISMALEEIEHLLIWSVFDHLWNEKKMYTLPGLGKNGAHAWHIINSGYRFSGRMPREIVYPWTLVRRGNRRIMNT